MGQNPYAVEIASTGGGPVKVAGDLTFTDAGNQPGGSSPYSDALLVRSSPSGVTFAGNVNKVFAPGDLSVVATVGTDLSLVDDGFGSAAFQTAAGGYFVITVTLDVTLTQNAGSALQRVLQFGQNGIDTQRDSAVSVPFVMVDGVEVVQTASTPVLLSIAAAGIFGAGPAYIPNNSIAADSYFVFYDATVVRLAPLA